MCAARLLINHPLLWTKLLGKTSKKGVAASTHLSSGLPLRSFILGSDVLQADFLKFTLLCLGRPLRQLLLSIHMAQAPAAQVPARIKVVCQCSTACTPSTEKMGPLTFSSFLITKKT